MVCENPASETGTEAPLTHDARVLNWILTRPTTSGLLRFLLQARVATRPVRASTSPGWGSASPERKVQLKII